MSLETLRRLIAQGAIGQLCQVDGVYKAGRSGRWVKV